LLSRDTDPAFTSRIYTALAKGHGLQHARRVIWDRIGFDNHRRPHRALGMNTPAEAYA
jgi:transposase InsO family protein